MDRLPDWMASFEALRAVYIDGAYSNMALNEAIPRHKGCRDSFVRNLVKGTIRSTVTLDYIIDILASGGIRKVKPRTLIILRMGLFALREMDSVPDNAAVNEAVRLAKKTARGTEGFVNAVLRAYIRRRSEFESESQSKAQSKIQSESQSQKSQSESQSISEIDNGIWSSIKDPVKRMSVMYSMPVPLVRLISEQYGDEAEAVMSGLGQTPSLVLRVNTLRTTRDELIEELGVCGIDAAPADESCRAVIASGSRVLETDAYRDGRFSVQSLSSMMAVEALGPAPGSRVLDMCAAPGGKSLMMAEMMENRGSITACDIYEHRLALIEAAAKRTGAGIISTRLADGTVYDGSMAGSFDYVLADVPCSGLGDMGIKPEIRLRTDPETYGELTDIQLGILKNAFAYVRPGGRICYSTCTINKNENEGVVRRFIEACEQDATACRGTEPGAGARDGFARIVEMNTILPYNNVIGFYCCIIEKDNII